MASFDDLDDSSDWKLEDDSSIFDGVPEFWKGIPKIVDPADPVQVPKVIAMIVQASPFLTNPN